MTECSMPLMDLLRKAGVEDVDFLRESLQHVLQRLIELEAALEIGAGKYQRSDERKTHRNGYRDRSLDTRLGTVDLRIPKLRQGSYLSQPA